MKTPLLTLTIASAAFFASNLSARPEGPPPPPDPETIVVEVFTDYDSDENNSLNQEELVAALQGMREKQMAKRQGDRPRMGRKASDEESTEDRPAKPNKGKRRGPPAPEDIAPRMIENHDKSGDGELNTEELLEALKGMHGQGRRGRGPRGGADAE